MKKCTVALLVMICLSASAQSNSDAERLRISSERAKIESAIALEETACYKKFLVNSCLDELRGQRRDALADLRRQEIVLNDEARKAKAAAQLQKTEDKSSPDQLQRDAEKRAQANKDFEERLAREKQKDIDRNILQAGEISNAQTSSARIKSNQDKEAARKTRQALAVEERRKFNQRQAEAQERQAQYAKDQAARAKSSAKPLPPP